MVGQGGGWKGDGVARVDENNNDQGIERVAGASEPGLSEPGLSEPGPSGPGPIAPIEGGPSRTLLAGDVACVLGCKSKRIVIHWAEKQGLPHDRGEPVSGGRRPYLFDFDEVKAWLVSRALPVYRNGAGEKTMPLQEATEGRSDEATKGEGENAPHAVPATPVVEVAGVASLSAENPPPSMALGGEVDWGNLKRAALERVHQLLAPPKVKEGEAAAEFSIEQRAKLADTIKREIGGLLSLDEKVREAEERAGRVIGVAEVREIFLEQASMFVSDLEALIADTPERIIEAMIASGIAPADLDVARRVLTVACSTSINAVRTRRAEALAQAVGQGNPLAQAVADAGATWRASA